MTFRENVMAILNYEKYDSFPVVSFGYWYETLYKWAREGHITLEEAQGYEREWDNSPADKSIMKKLGFDFNWNSCYEPKDLLFPAFEEEILEKRSNGSIIKRDAQGLIVQEKPGVVSIPAEIGTSLVDREAWEKLYLIDTFSRPEGKFMITMGNASTKDWKKESLDALFEEIAQGYSK